MPTSIDEVPVDARRKTNWARLIQKVYEVDPLECPNCGSTMRMIALIHDANVVERILRHLKVWDPIPDSIIPAGPEPPSPTALGVALRPACLQSWPKGETLPLSDHPVPEIA